MRLHFIKCVLILLCIALGCTEVEQAPDLDQAIFVEDEAKGILEMNLKWKVNGISDDGMMSDLSLYLSRSNSDYTELDPSLSAVNLSSFDFSGGARMTPSTRTLRDAYRYYIGVAFNGILPAAQSISFPITISYSIEIYYQNIPEEVKIIEGKFVITESDLSKTRVEYLYTMDIIDSENEAEFKSYSIRRLVQPIQITRISDVENTDTFSAEKTLYIEMVWKVNGIAQGYTAVDLDLFLHDTNNTNIQNFTDLDFFSTREALFERILVEPSSAKFKQGIPEKLGFYFFSKNGSPSSTLNVDYMYKVYSYDGKIKRFVVYGSFISPPVLEHTGKFYFAADITRNGTTYKIQKLTPVFQWQP